MRRENGQQKELDNLVNYIKQNTPICKFGIVQSITDKNTCIVDFKEQNLSPIECSCVRVINYKKVIKEGDVVRVEFSDVYEKNFLANQQTKINNNLCHNLANGIIVGVYKLYNEDQEDVLFYCKDKLFNILNKQYSLKKNNEDIKEILQDFNSILSGTLQTLMSTLMPTPATSGALTAYVQSVNELLTKINTLSSNMTKLFTDYE